MSIRVGHSWRTAHGGRSWVSAPLLLWAALSLLVVPFAVAWSVLWVLGHVPVWGWRGGVWVARKARRTPPAPEPSWGARAVGGQPLPVSKTTAGEAKDATDMQMTGRGYRPEGPWQPTGDKWHRIFSR